MQHIRIAIYELAPKATFDHIRKVAQDAMLPVFARHPGFLRYGVANAGREVISISLWETQAEATAANALAAEFVRENLADQATLKHNYVGDVAFFSEAHEHEEGRRVKGDPSSQPHDWCSRS
jgi:hypothetical protein